MLELAGAWQHAKDKLDQYKRDLETLPGLIASERAQLRRGGRYAYIHAQNVSKAETDLLVAKVHVPELEAQLRDLEKEYREAGFDDINFAVFNSGEHWVGGTGIARVGRAVRDGESPAGPTPTNIEPDVALLFGSGLPKKGLVRGALRAATRRRPRPQVDIDAYVRTLKRTKTPTRNAAFQYEIKHTGPYNYELKGGGATFEIDGYRGSTILEAKHVRDPATSPFVPGSSCDERIRTAILNKVRAELTRARTIINSGTTPFNSLEIVTNSQKAKVMFEAIMKELAIPGSVRVAP
jgi:hypothetical protein